MSKVRLLPLLYASLRQRKLRKALYVDKGIFYPSQSEMCPRMAAFCYLGIPKDKTFEDVEAILRQDGGNCIHEFAQKYLENIEDIKFTREVSLEDKETGIKGRCDGVFYLDGEKYVLEIKSVTPDKWKYLRGIKVYHKAQANIYAGLLEARGVLFWYISTDFKKIAEFFLPFDNELYKDTLKEFARIKKIVLSGSLPEKDTNFCDFCDYSQICKVIKGNTPLTKNLERR